MDEQTQQTTENGEQLASRDDLLAALAEAGGAEAEGKALDADAAEKPAESAPTAQEKPADEPRIAAVLRAREEAAKKRLEAEDYASQLKRQAEEDAERIRTEAKQRAEREWAEEVASKRRHFAENPREALRSLAKDPQDIVDAVVKEGTPEWKMIRQLQEQLSETSKRAAVADEVKTEFQKWKEAQEQEKREAFISQVKQEFLNTYASPEKMPYTHARFDSPDEVFSKADAIARQWQKDGLRLGVDFDRNDVAEYLEDQSRKKLASLGIAPQQVGGAAAGKAAGMNAPKVTANGSRTLSAATGSERRTSPKPISEMTPEEARQALIDAAAEARRTNKS